MYDHIYTRPRRRHRRIKPTTIRSLVRPRAACCVGLEHGRGGLAFSAPLVSLAGVQLLHLCMRFEVEAKLDVECRFVCAGMLVCPRS